MAYEYVGGLVVLLLARDVAELHFELVLLAPFEEFRLEVLLFLCEFLEVYILPQHLLLYKAVAMVVAAVEVYCSHEGFEGVATYVVVPFGTHGKLHEFHYPHPVGKLVERSALHYLAARGGEESLTTAGIVVEDDVGDDGFEYGIAEVFHAFVADVIVAHGLGGHRLMGEGHTIQSDVLWIKTKDLETRTHLLEYLKENGIHAVFHYVPLHSAPAGRKYGYFFGEDKYTTTESERLLRLPLYYGLTPKAIDCVVDAIFRFYEVQQ